MLIPFHDDNPLKRWPIVTIVIIAANVAGMLYVSGLDMADQARLYATYGFVPARLGQLADPAKVVEVKLNPMNDPAWPPNKPEVVKLEAHGGEIILSLLTTMFLHGGWLHLLGNMWFFWIFGNNIEDRLGSLFFTIFYVIGGLIASAMQWAMTPAGGADVPIVGASGAVAVILGAYAVTYPTARVRTLVILFIITIIELPALVVLGVWFLFQIVPAMMELNANAAAEGVAWWAHIGGFIAGLVIMPFLSAGTPEPKEDWEGEAKRQFQFGSGTGDGQYPTYTRQPPASSEGIRWEDK
jgi:membrane associated rhomboid family serine protease